MKTSNSRWRDASFIAELRRREKSYLKGKAKTYTLEQAIARARQAIKKVRSKNT